ncbi:insulin-induced protein-domain-containing protein [Aspergillus crustosus]
MSDDEVPILRPRPQRVFRLNDSSGSSTPVEPSTLGDTLNPKGPGSAAISRNGSIMNLTSPTLYGIYSPTAFESTRDEYTWGTEAGVQPSNPGIPPAARRTDSAAVLRSRSRLSQGLFRGVILPQTFRSVLLFAFGVAYGIITIHLHENHWITPVKLDYAHFYGQWEYVGFWGLTGVAVGNVLPWLDSYLNGAADGSAHEKRSNNRQDSELALSWPAVVRSVGAFVGIAFAMRRTPWESTTQASLTLALVNPVLWYLIDRTKTGFILSTTLAVAGMGVLLGLKPDLIPSTEQTAPAIPSLNGTGAESTIASVVTQESVAVRTWVASVLFCACVCFGNIGRQLAIGVSRETKS